MLPTVLCCTGRAQRVQASRLILVDTRSSVAGAQRKEFVPLDLFLAASLHFLQLYLRIVDFNLPTMFSLKSPCRLTAST